MNKIYKLTLLIGLLAGAPARADQPASEVEALMKKYIELWNAGDAVAITSQIYDFEVPDSRGTSEGLNRFFSDLRTQGLDPTVLVHSGDQCLLTKDAAMAVLRFSRNRNDGSALPPKEYQALYLLKLIPDGWRIRQIVVIDPSAEIHCTSPKP